MTASRYSFESREFRQLPSEIDSLANERWEQFIAYDEQEKFDEAEKMALSAWEALPEPRTEWDYFSNVIPFTLTEFYRDRKEFNMARKWLGVTRTTYGPGLDATVEFLAATINFEANELDLAFEEFQRQYIEFGEAPFENEDPKYLRFTLEHMKDGN